MLIGQNDQILRLWEPLMDASMADSLADQIVSRHILPQLSANTHGLTRLLDRLVSPLQRAVRAVLEMTR